MPGRPSLRWNTGSGIARVPPTPAVSTQPPQPGVVGYGDPIDTAKMAEYAHAGGMAIGGRSSYSESVFQTISAAGGHFLIYLDPIVWNNFGRYHGLLFNSSVYGAAVPEWPPGNINCNATGDLADFRPGSILQSKLEGVLEAMVSENPHMAGFFMDDVGSKSHYPGFVWEDFGTQNQLDYRAGALDICRTVRTVCDRHGLINLVNGTWTGLQGLTFVERGGGYPDMETHGCSLADGGVVEHHDSAHDGGNVNGFWGPYMDPATSQWGDESSVTHGAPMCFVIASEAAGTTEYRTKKPAWVTAAQLSDDYGGVSPWGTVNDFHPTGLPTVRRN